MNYANIKKTDVANGPGIRVSLFVSGCTHRCKGCFNSEAWDFHYGREYTQETEEEILEALEPDYIKGLSILGGEPMEPENRGTVLKLLKAVRKRYPQKNIWCYTGYTYQNGILAEPQAICEATREMISLLDVLVDGPFVEELKDIRLKFRGSSNQRVIDVQNTLSSGRIVLHLA